MNHPTTTPPAPATDAEERWYLRIDGHNYGPATRTDLERFLQPPRLCSVMEVKCGDGVWFTIARHETIDKVLAKVGIVVEPVQEPSHPSSTSRSQGGALRDFCGGLGAWLVHHRRKAARVLVYGGLGVAAFLAFRDPYVGDREFLSRYETLWREARRFGTETTDSDWRTFADRRIAELEPILRELERSASVHQPIRQNLLFAGRDHLRSILKESHPPAATSSHVQLFERRLELARDQLSADNTKLGHFKANVGWKGAL